MTTIPLATSVTLPVGDVSQGTDYYIGVNAQGHAHIGTGLGTSVFGVAVPANLHTWAITLDTTNADPSATCLIDPLFSIDASEPSLQLPGNGEFGFPGGTWTNPKTGVTSGAREIGPDQLQQNPYPTKFILHVTRCTVPMLLNSVSLVVT